MNPTATPKRTARIEVREADVVGADEAKYYLVLIASNGRILATSEVYDNHAKANNAIGAWKRAFRQVLA